MKKYKIMAVVCMILCIAFPVSAVTGGVGYSVAEDSFTLSGKAVQEKVQSIAVEVYYPGKSPADLNNEELTEVIHFVDSIVSDEKGDYSAKIGFEKDDPSGFYGVWVRSEIEDMPLVPLAETYRINEADTVSEMTRLRTISRETDTEALESFITEYTVTKPVINMSFDDYYTVNKDAILSLMCGILKNAQSFADLEGSYPEAKALHKVNNATTETIDGIMDENVIFLGLSENSDYATYKQAVNKFIADHENFTSADELGVFVKNKVMVLLVNNQSDSEIMNEAIEKYYAEYGIDFDEYKKFSSYTVLKTLLSKNYNTPSDFGDAVNNRLSQLKDNAGSSGGPGGTTGSKNENSVGKTNPADIYIGSKDNVFKDVLSTDWFNTPVKALKAKGIISPAEYFRPQSNVTREEFVKMLVVALGITDTSAKTEFSDTSKEDWHYTYIASAVKEGIVKGIGNNMFGVGRQITRQDMAVMAYNAAKLAGKDFDTTKKEPFADSAHISPYAQEAVYAMRNCGVINGMGDNTFAPLEFCTRAQAAKIIYNLI